MSDQVTYDLPAAPPFAIEGRPAFFSDRQIQVPGHPRARPDAWADNSVYAIPFRGDLTEKNARARAHAALRKRLGFLLWGGSSAGYQEMLDVIQHDGWGYVIGWFRHPLGD